MCEFCYTSTLHTYLYTGIVVTYAYTFPAILLHRTYIKNENENPNKGSNHVGQHRSYHYVYTMRYVRSAGFYIRG